MSSGENKFPYPSTENGGNKTLSIRGIYEDERYRISEEYNDEERRWRHQWFKDQILAEDEPRYVPELERELKNPIRRLVSYPWQMMENAMTPVFGQHFAKIFRWNVPKLLVGFAGVYAGYYYMKYHQKNWTDSLGLRVTYSRPSLVPGDKGYPFKRDRFEPSDYYDCGFKDRKVFLD